MLISRCDAGPDIGAGHFFRQLALAEYAVEQGDEAHIFMHQPPAGLAEHADACGVGLVHIPHEPASMDDARFVRERAADADSLVVDGYHFPPEYYREADGPCTLAAVDDIAQQHFPVDILVNQNIDAENLDYDTPERTTELLGLDYLLLRRQFRRARRRLEQSGGPEVSDRIENVLVFLGGGDPTNETAKVLRGLDLADYRGELDVLLGESNPHEDKIRRLGRELSANMEFHRNVTDMADLIAGHDLSINNGGSVSWELACLGIPMLQIIVADNQRPVVEGLVDREISTCLGNKEDVTPERVSNQFSKMLESKRKRRHQTKRGLNLVDGAGVRRVFDTLN